MSLKLYNSEEAYKKDSNLKKEDVKTILDHLKTRQHLPELTELQAILFLHSCNYCIETAEKTIDNYFTLHTLHPHIFESASEEVIKRVFSYNFMWLLPEKTEDGEIVAVMSLLHSQTQDYNYIESLQVSTMILELYLHQYGPANGLIAVADTANMGIGHMFKMNWGAAKISFKYFQEALPVRIKGLHYINVNKITEKCLNWAKCLLNKEVANMMNCHSSLENLYKFVPKKYLPEDYGGTLPPIKKLHEECLQNVLDNSDFFKWRDSQKVDETKRFVEHND